MRNTDRPRQALLVLGASLCVAVIGGLVSAPLLTNIPDEKLDRFDPIKELPTLQRSLGDGASYSHMSASGLRRDGTLDLRAHSSASYTFFVPRADSGYDLAVIDVQPPGLNRALMVERRLRWKRGISTRRLEHTTNPVAQRAPTCAIGAMIARTSLPERSNQLPYIDLRHEAGIYTLSAGNSFDDDATTLKFDKDCAPLP